MIERNPAQSCPDLVTLAFIHSTKPKRFDKEWVWEKRKYEYE